MVAQAKPEDFPQAWQIAVEDESSATEESGMIRKAHLMIDRRYRWVILALLGTTLLGFCSGVADRGLATPGLDPGADASRDAGH